MGKPLTQINRLEMLDLQKTRTRATQLTRAKDTPSKIHKRSFTASSYYHCVLRPQVIPVLYPAYILA